jgi:flagellin
LSQTSEFTNALVAKINSAGIANVTARENSGQTRVIIEASKGTDIRLAFSDAAGTGTRSSYASALGIASSFFGATQGSANEVSDFNGQSSAIAKAAAINSVQSKSGVVATVETTNFSNTAAVAVGSVAANSFYINGTAVDATTGITGNDGTGALRAAINAKTSSTGVTATVNTSGFLVLSAADGRNISLYVDSGATTATGLTQGANVYRSSLKFASNNSVTFAGSTTDVGGLNTNSPYTPDLNNSLSLIDISTQSGANTALTSIDTALQQVSQSAANVGALQNRLDLTVQSLQTAAQNQTAAESRIRDADFAYETSQFTRNQILVQAGTAILAQANSSTQIALQLLK